MSCVSQKYIGFCSLTRSMTVQQIQCHVMSWQLPCRHRSHNAPKVDNTNISHICLQEEYTCNCLHSSKSRWITPVWFSDRRKSWVWSSLATDVDFRHSQKPYNLTSYSPQTYYPAAYIQKSCNAIGFSKKPYNPTAYTKKPYNPTAYIQNLTIWQLTVHNLTIKQLTSKNLTIRQLIAHSLTLLHLVIQP